MNVTLDPYLEWLQIPVDHRPPNDYQLLGLAVGESDIERISAAYHERYVAVRRYQIGTYAEIAQQLLDELSAAFQAVTSAATSPAGKMLPSRSPVEAGRDGGGDGPDVEDGVPLVENDPLVNASMSGAIDKPLDHAARRPTGHDATSTAKQISSTISDAQQDLPARIVTTVAILSGVSTVVVAWLPSVAVCFGALACVFGIWHFANQINTPPARMLGNRFRVWIRKRQQYAIGKRAWQAKVRVHERQVNESQARHVKLKKQRESIKREKTAALAEVENRSQERQRTSFLRSHTIRQHAAAISQLDLDGLRELESAGINTAADIDFGKIIAMDGLSDAATTSLVAWRVKVEGRFRYNAREAPREEIEAIEQNFLEKTQVISAELQQESDNLLALHETSRAELVLLKDGLCDCEHEVVGAWRDVMSHFPRIRAKQVAIALIAFGLPLLIAGVAWLRA